MNTNFNLAANERLSMVRSCRSEAISSFIFPRTKTAEEILGTHAHFCKRVFKSGRQSTFVVFNLSGKVRMRCALLLTLAGIAPVANAELKIPKQRCQDPQQTQTLVLNVEAGPVNGKAGLHWVIKGLPSGDDIQVTDPGLKRAIQNWITAQNKLNPKPNWVLDGKTPWSLFSSSGLSGGVTASRFTITFPFIPPPSDAEPAKPYPVQFCETPAAEKRLDALEIQIISESYDFDKPKPAQQLNASLAPKVTASALLSDADSNGEKQTVLNAFSIVAETVWNSARQNGIVIGAEADDALLRKAEVSIANIYNMAQDNIAYQFWGLWPQPRAIFHYTTTGKCCILSVQNLRMATKACIRVEANLPSNSPAAKQRMPIATRPGITAHPDPIPTNRPTPQNDREKRAAALAGRTEKMLTQRFGSELAAFHDTVPTFDQVDTLRSHLAAASEIYPSIRLAVLEGQPSVIVFDTDNRWTMADVTLSAGAGYSVEDKATGKVDIQGGNLLGVLFNLRDRLNLKETENMTYSGGNEVQKANASWGLNWTRSLAHGAQSTYGPQLSGDFLQDHNQRFGNETGPVLRDHEIGWGPSCTWLWTSALVTKNGDAASHTFGLSADTGLKQLWFRISPTRGNLVPPNSKGDFTAFFVNLTPGYHYVPGSPFHFGGVDVTAEAHFLQGLPAGGYTFTQVFAAVRATVFFGSSHPRDFFLRFRKGMGTSNGATPLLELFRLGGTDNTRGLEQGEQVGRLIALEQSEAGISARRIVSWFQKPSHSDLPPKSSPIDLTRVFVKTFYDRGRVSTTGAFTDLLVFSRGAKGYGIAVEIQTLAAGNKRISLSLGYARSPDSVLHTNGVPITSASVDF
jgi:hypothetical protein